MNTLPKATIQIIQYLKNKGIDPILYGSQGVSLYLGDFKSFGDIDFLVEDKYINARLQSLLEAMKEAGYILINQHEHEFKNDNGQLVAFASQQILLRDGIINSFSDIVEVDVGSTKVKTLSANDFIKAYGFSKNDGYRKHIRGKNDQHIIDLLKEYAQ